MSSALEKFRGIVVVNSDYAALQLSMDLKKRPKGEQFAAFAGDGTTGFFYLHTNQQLQPDTVMECVMSRDGGDSVTALYRAHPIFESKGDLMKARLELMRALAEKVGLPIESIGIDDQARGRALGLEELSTGQLIDLLAEKVGQAVLATDTHNIETPDTGTSSSLEQGKLIEAPLSEAGVLQVQADGSVEVV